MSHMDDDQMSIVDHITELRKRIIYVLIMLVVGLIGGFLVADLMYQFVLSRPPADEYEFVSLSLWDGVSIYMKFALLVAIAVSLPFTTYQLWAFVSPGLKPEERKATVKYIPYVFVLFIAGISFAYFVVLPMAFEFTASINQHLNLKEMYSGMQYLNFMFNIVMPMGLLFELPLVIMFLTAIRLLNPIRLRKMRKFAYFILVVLGVTLSPPDVMSDILVSVPLLILYEISVWLSTFIYRKQLRKQQEWEEQFARGEASAS